MKKEVYFLVFEPLKYNWKIAPVQVMIQIRTWGKATHVGMIWNEKQFQKFITKMSEVKVMDRANVINSFESAGLVVSATFPKVTIENIFTDYVNYRIYVKGIEVSEYQYSKIHRLWEERIGKQKYSLLGLVWFVTAPFIDWIKKTKDVDPDGGFCSEVATNILYQSGVKVFSFLGNKFEDDLLLARSMSLEDYVNSGLGTERFWHYANNTKKFNFGYKVSPKMFKLSPIFSSVGILDIRKDKIYYHE